MMELLAYQIGFGACLGILFVLFAPQRSELWRSIKLWAEDNELAALVREERRAARRPKTSPEPQDQAPCLPASARINGTGKLFDNGREYRVGERA